MRPFSVFQVLQMYTYETSTLIIRGSVVKLMIKLIISLAISTCFIPNYIIS